MARNARSPSRAASYPVAVNSGRREERLAARARNPLPDQSGDPWKHGEGECRSASVGPTDAEPIHALGLLDEPLGRAVHEWKPTAETLRRPRPKFRRSRSAVSDFGQ